MPADVPRRGRRPHREGFLPGWLNKDEMQKRLIACGLQAISLFLWNSHGGLTQLPTLCPCFPLSEASFDRGISRKRTRSFPMETRQPHRLAAPFRATASPSVLFQRKAPPPKDVSSLPGELTKGCARPDCFPDIARLSTRNGSSPYRSFRTVLLKRKPSLSERHTLDSIKTDKGPHFFSKCGPHGYVAVLRKNGR